MIKSLKELAKYREIKDFDLDLEKLDTFEGRAELKHSLDPLGVSHLNIIKKLADIESEEILRRMLLNDTKNIVRVYAISGYDFASRDIGGFSDPYLLLKVGSREISDRKEYQLDEPNPNFYKHYDFEQIFPGCPMVEVRAMDHDMLFGDELIGTTFVDLEDRYFLPEWMAIRNKPVEYRPLHHPSSACAQGVIKMWVEINDAQCSPEEMAPVWDIGLKPPETFEVRLCVFDGRDVTMLDSDGSADVYFRAFFDSNKDALETDTHFRCQNGKPSFNYRLVYQVEIPRKQYTLTIQCYDRDFFSPNEIIGSYELDLTKPFEDCSLCKRLMPLNKDYYNKHMLKEDKSNILKWKEDNERNFYVPLNAKDKDGKITFNGEARLQIDIVPIKYATDNKVGSARDEPNVMPFLPPPVGRIFFTLNPCKLFEQFVGPALRRKIYMWCCGIFCSVICVAILYFVVPGIISDVIANAI